LSANFDTFEKLMKILVVSASLGGFDTRQFHEEQSMECDYFQYTDENFPPRSKSMTPRLQARIPKMMSWQMNPGYDYYLWVDSSCRLADKDSVKWFLEQLEDADIAVFKHPHRQTIQEEADYLKERLELEKAGKKHQYILPRYENEDIDGQLKEVDPNAKLYASTAFIYKNDEPARDLLKIWWYNTSLFHSIDQLSLPHAITSSGAKANVIPDNYLKCKYLKYVRNK
jgi:hypothetical protein